MHRSQNLCRSIYVGVFAALAPIGAIAADENCDDPASQEARDRCALIEFEAADSELNELWPQVEELARGIDEFEAEELKGAQNALIDSQHNWTAMRDSHCALEGFQARGGSMEPIIVSGCKARMTRERIRQLRTLVQELGMQ